MPIPELHERETLRRLLAVVVSLCLGLFGWSATRELGRIAESTASTAALVGRLDERVGSLLIDNASISRRLDYVEQALVSSNERHERGCGP